MEMAVLISVLVAALVAMQVYLKRGIQGRLKANVESIGEQYDPQATAGESTLSHVTASTTTTTTDLDEVDTWACPPGYSPPSSYCQRATQEIQRSTSATQIHYDNTVRSGSETVAAP